MPKFGYQKRRERKTQANQPNEERVCPKKRSKKNDRRQKCGNQTGRYAHKPWNESLHARASNHKRKGAREVAKIMCERNSHPRQVFRSTRNQFSYPNLRKRRVVVAVRAHDLHKIRQPRHVPDTIRHRGPVKIRTEADAVYAQTVY